MSQVFDPFGLVDASRGSRLAAFCVDAVIGVAASGPTLITGGDISAGTMLISSFLVALLTIVQVVLLTRSGQTLGKRALGIRIVRMETGQNGGFVVNVLVRTVANWILCLIPFYSLADTLFIFREDRRCIHDLLAGTRVVYK